MQEQSDPQNDYDNNRKRGQQNQGVNSPRHHSAWRSALKTIPTVARSIADFFSFVTTTPAFVLADDALDPELVSVLVPF